MLDPTRVPDPSKLHRGDIEDLVVRRFRSSPEVVSDLGRVVPERKLNRRAFPLSREEEIAYEAIAELKLDLDAETSRGRGVRPFFEQRLPKPFSPAPLLAQRRSKDALKALKTEQPAARRKTKIV